MRAWRRSALLLAWSWLGTTACGEAFSTGGGDGGSGGTATGTSTGSASGSPTGTATGTATGTGTGTESGTPAGSTTTEWVCPSARCIRDAPRNAECVEPCMVAVCQALPSCCTAGWGASCVALALRTCGMAECPEACKELFGELPEYTPCSFTLDTNACAFLTNDGTSCETICGDQGVSCLLPANVVCEGGYTVSACDVVNNTGGMMVCMCAKTCGDSELPCPPAERCSPTGCG